MLPMKPDPAVRIRNRIRDEAAILWSFLGDSITHGAVHTWGQRDYVELFDEQIRVVLGRRMDLVINGSYNGYDTNAMLPELEHRCLRFRPDIVGIALGMNDAARGRDGVGTFVANLRAMITQIRATCGAEVFLQTPVLIDYAGAPSRAALPGYVAAIREMGSSESIAVCDHYAAWETYAAEPGKQIADVLANPFHPNAEGHRLMATTLLEWLGIEEPLRLCPAD